uniref:Uncharacterized protein n=1 Tax=Arundo donax TaxID=35708 RepID=A0A0A9B5E4_ARUDO
MSNPELLCLVTAVSLYTLITSLIGRFFIHTSIYSLKYLGMM